MKSFLLTTILVLVIFVTSFGYTTSALRATHLNVTGYTGSLYTFKLDGIINSPLSYHYITHSWQQTNQAWVWIWNYPSGTKLWSNVSSTPSGSVTTGFNVGSMQISMGGECTYANLETFYTVLSTTW